MRLSYLLYCFGLGGGHLPRKRVASVLCTAALYSRMAPCSTKVRASAAVSISWTASEPRIAIAAATPAACPRIMYRSEEHTSELQSLRHLVCRLLLEKKKSSTQHILL